MTVYNEPRKNVIRLAIIVLFVIVVVRLFILQVVSSKYRTLADDQGLFRKVVYPDRGIVFDRNKQAVLEITTISDLMVVPNKVTGIDTTAFLSILGHEPSQYRNRRVEIMN